MEIRSLRAAGAFVALMRGALVLAVCAFPALALAQEFSKEQVDQLTAQIALYPDSLLSQVLMASTYPADVAEAAKWSREHPDAKGDDAVGMVQDRDWDPSVASLVAFPQVIVTMGEKPDWVKDLGDAFLAQPEQVMDSVQRLRASAQKAGNLKSNEQMNVRVETAPPADPQVTVVQQAAPAPQVIYIEPAQPQVVYVPSYNPAVVYGAWPYPSYPPVYVPPPPGYWWSAAVGGAVATGIAWGVSYAVRDALWGGCNWWHRDVNINVNRYNNINVNRRLDINTRNTNWAHNTDRRRAVPYRGGDATRQQLARKMDANKRDAYRGRAEAAMRDRGVQVDRAVLRDRAQNVDRDQLRSRAQNVDRDALRQRAQNVDRDQVRARAQNVDRDALRQRAQNVDRDAVRQRAQNVDRDAVRRQAQSVNRENAFRGANDRQARQQVNRGQASRQAMQRGGGGGAQMVRAGGGKGGGGGVQRAKAKMPSGGGGGNRGGRKR